MNISGSVILLVGLLVAPNFVSAQTGTAPDNTRINKRDRASGAVTADQQKETVNDREITANIRKSIMANKDLSTYAHNVKIISAKGSVTLKGPVRSAEEKKTVETLAAEVAGEGKVKSMISVKPKS